MGDLMTCDQFLAAFQNGILGTAVNVRFTEGFSAIVEGAELPLLSLEEFDMFVVEGQLVLGLWQRPDDERLWLKATLAYDPEFRAVYADEPVAGRQKLSRNPASRAPDISRRRGDCSA